MKARVATAGTIFESERLSCRRWKPEDIEALVLVYTDAEAMRWVGDGKPIDRSACEKWIQVTEANYAKHGYGMFALLERQSSKVIGFCGLVHPGGQAEGEVKYALLRSHWGHGLASEAVPELLAYGSKQHRLARVIATVAAENLSSQRVLAKAGMKLLEIRNNESESQTYVFEWLAQNAA